MKIYRLCFRGFLKNPSSKEQQMERPAAPMLVRYYASLFTLAGLRAKSVSTAFFLF